MKENGGFWNCVRNILIAYLSHPEMGRRGKKSHFWNQQFFGILILNEMQDKFHEHVYNAEFSANMKHIIERSTH